MGFAPVESKKKKDAETRLRGAFETRLVEVVRHVAEQADLDTLSSVMSRTGSVSALAEAIASAAGLLEQPHDPLATARARGAAARMRLVERAGGMLRVGEAAARLGVSRSAVSARRSRGTILAVPLANGEEVYPAVQFTDAGIPSGMGEFLRAFRSADAWTKLSVLTAPSRRHGGRSAIELLRDGETEAAVGIAARHGEHLG